MRTVIGLIGALILIVLGILQMRSANAESYGAFPMMTIALIVMIASSF